MHPRKRIIHEEYDDRTESPAAHRRVTSGSRLGWWISRLTVAVVCLAILVAIAPTIAVNTSLWPWALGKVKEQTGYEVKTARPSLGWFTPVSIPGLEVRDAKGELLVTADAVQINKTLLALALNQKDLGTITLHNPKVRVTLPQGNEPPTTPPVDAANAGQPAAVPQLAVRVINGTLELVDPRTNNTWTLTQIQAAVDTPAAPELPYVIDAAFQVASLRTPQPGTARVQGHLALPPLKRPVGTMNIDIAGLDLSLLQPLLRSAGDISPAGMLTLKTAVELTAQGGVLIRLEQLAGSQIAVAAPKYLGNDIVSIQQLGGQGELAILGDQMVAKQLVVASEVARVEADGILRLSDSSLAGLFQAFAKGESNEPLQVAAQVDVARVLKMLPNTVPLRAGTQIESGTAIVQVRRDPQATMPRVVGQVQLSDLVARNAGKDLRWDKPVAASFAVSQSAQGPQLEQLACRADFLQLDASGTLAAGQAKVQGDLNRLMVELDKVIDVPELQLAGALQGNIEWKQDAAQQWDAQTTVSFKDFALQAPGLQPWREKDLQIAAHVVGALGEQGLTHISQGTASVVSGKDRLDAQLTAPVAQPSATSTWPISWKLAGNLATWIPRLQPVAPVQGVRAEGEFDVTGAAAVSPTAVAVDKLTLNGRQIRALVGGILIDEDELQVELTASWDQKQGRVAIPVTTLASSTLAFRGDQLQVTYGGAGFSAAGVIDYRADLERLMALVADPEKPVESRFMGGLGGRLTVGYQNGVTTAKLNGVVNDLVYATLPPKTAGAALASTAANAWKVQWKEANVGIQGGVAYNALKDELQLSGAGVQASQIRVVVDGVLASLSKAPHVDVRGKLAYNMADIAEKLRPLLGETLAMEGEEERAFSLRGPLGALSVSSQVTATTTPGATTPNTVATQPVALVSNDLAGEVSAGWKSAQYLGLNFGRADIQAQLAQGKVEFQPINIPVSDGRLVASPHVLLNNSPPLATFDRGLLLDKVGISPELCRGWLMFVAPLLANATSAEGRFSVNLEGAAVPLFEPAKCDVAGTFMVHDATVGPGPITSQLVGLVQQVRSIVDSKPFDPAGQDGRVWLNMSDQKVDFRVVNGRVHHKGMKFILKDVELVTDGSVGFDQTVELVATIPLRDEWLKKELLAAGLKGQVVQIPIRGHIARPQLDGRALEDLSKKFVKKAAQGIIEDQLNKGFQKLFGPMR